jgi:hypothetical protein
MIEILEAYRSTKGVGKLVVMVSLRDYLRRTALDVAMDEIRTLTNESDLNILLGAGLRGVLYYVVISQKAELMGI